MASESKKGLQGIEIISGQNSCFERSFRKRAQNHGAPPSPARVYKIPVWLRSDATDSGSHRLRPEAMGEKSEGVKVAGNYWSSSTNVNNPANAWIVNFNNGNANNNNRTNNNYVRCLAGTSIVISLPPDAYSVDSLYKAYMRCRKGKRGFLNTRGFESNLFNELASLSELLTARTYAPSRSVLFYVEKPKLREVFAADFRDRVVHRLLVDLLEPHYEKAFISDSYACRKEKGTHAAVARLNRMIWSGSDQARGPFFFLQLDIKGFFMEIHKDVLLAILKKRVSPDLFWLVQILVEHNPSENFVLRGSRPAAGVLPPHKTLFHSDSRRGIPIGNLTSQFFANVYLNELDQFIKRKLGVKNTFDTWMILSYCTGIRRY